MNLKSLNQLKCTWILKTIGEVIHYIGRLGTGHLTVVLFVISHKRWIKYASIFWDLKKVSVLPVSDPARCVTELALCRLCRLAELRRLESSVLEDCLVRCRPTPRPWWKRPSASTSWSDRRCIDEDIIGPAWPPVWPLEFNGPWWSICKKNVAKSISIWRERLPIDHF